MIPAPSLDDLARRIHERRAPNPSASRGPFILFVGEGCSRAAGAPTRDEIARTALSRFEFEPNLGPEASPGALWERFQKHTSSMSASQFGRMLKSLYASVPVPAFYRDLASLVRERYFPLIFTTNFDTLLEQALLQSGVRSSEYQVTTFDTRTKLPTSSPLEPLTHIIKLHGDLAQNTAYVSPEQIDGALQTSRHWIKSDLAGDIVMIGHVVDDRDPINRWLSHSPQRELWWIDKDPAPPQARSWTSDLQEITGDLGRPGVFLSQLALRLLRAPDSAPAETAAEAAFEAYGGAAREPATLENLEREILRNQSLLYNLDQGSNPRERPQHVQAQIIHQKRQIVRLEDRARALPETQGRVVEAVDAILQAAQLGAKLGKPTSDVVDYVQEQRNTLLKEFKKETPNQIVVTATLGATLAVADRMLTEFGTEVIRPDDVKRLAAFVPTAAGKVVL